jgi:hypothetical protein
MNNRRTILMVLATALVALCLPVLASAQGTYDQWGRRRNDRDYRRDNDYGRYNLRDVARRVSNLSHDFQRHLDDALDRSRYDDTRREDRINDMAKEFRNAANDFRNEIGDGRNYNRGANEAQRLLQLGSRIDNVVSRIRLDSRSASEWSQIRQDLRVIADAYNYRYNGGYGGYGRDDDRNRRRDTNAPWWDRIRRP